MRSHSRRLASVTSFVIAFVSALAGLPCAGCTNTASTEPGDHPQDAGLPSPLGNGLRIAQMNAPTSPQHPANNQMNVTVTGATYVVTDTYAETNTASSIGSIYVQDFSSPVDGGGAPPYSGIELYKTTFLPADLGLAPGDVIDFTGEYQEYDGPSSFSFGASYQPEMYEPIVTFRFDYAPPTPTPILMKDLLAYSTGFQWMSMLVVVNGFNVPGDLVSGGVYDGGDGRCGVFLSSNTSEGQPYMDNELFNLPCQGVPDGGPDAWVAPGTPIKSVAGIVTYFGNFTLSPRSIDDIAL